MIARFPVYVVIACVAAVSILVSRPDAEAGKADSKVGGKVLSGVQTGNPEIKAISQISFGPGGLLLVGDRGRAAVLAIQTGDKGPVQRLKAPVKNVAARAAEAMGAKPGSVGIVDMTVNPESGRIYLAVLRTQGKQYAILTVDAAGKFSHLDLDNASYVRVSLPAAEQEQISNITDVEFAGDRVLAAGQSNGAFRSKIFSIPVPLTHGSSAEIFSAETYHVSHRRWETRAPISSFVPYEEDGKNFIVGSFACTPIAKFPLDDVQSGAKIMGTSVVELGSGNRPLDMFTYRKDGKTWLVTNTNRFHHEKRPIGPSPFWGVRVDMEYMKSAEVNEKAARRNATKRSGPEGMDVVEVLFGVTQVAKLNDDEMIVIRENGKAFDLEVAQLP
ncbi:MAG: hypothetical protein CMJ48_09015 [Planctomycetaceae bacterium]|nr:hypothetical protein [Planctomycetaceae bacterium]